MECVAPARSVLASRRILRWSRLIQHPPKFSLLIFRQFPSARCLRLKEGPKENTIVELGADAAQIPIVQLLPDSLGLEYLGFAFPAPLAHHALV